MAVVYILWHTTYDVITTPSTRQAQNGFFCFQILDQIVHLESLISYCCNCRLIIISFVFKKVN